ncbi:MAG: hypothetical protein IKL87_08355 [Oscillospiraceae bacterium]|nr:hypothetical protein [Oscillospiraceae bacterium]
MMEGYPDHTSVIMKLPVLTAMPLGIRILLVLLALLIIAVILIVIFASKNVREMNLAIDDAISAISAEHTVTPVDPGTYSELKVYKIMKFHVEQYEVADIGNLSVMKVNMGLMQMATIILTPTQKNLPLISADYMYMFGKRTAYLEFYDFVTDQQTPEYQSLLSDLNTVKESYSALENASPTPAWYDTLKTVGIYKNAKAKDDPTLRKILCDGFGTVMNAAKSLPLLTEEEQRTKTQLCKDYSDGLIEHGGISTDVFKKELGETTTRDFFDQVLFGTNRNTH